MISRFFFCCLALFIFVVTTQAKGTYQRTKDDKTIVWNNDPKPGDSADWNGDRDAEGYADGFGTLTWYSGNATVHARFYGNMVHGKFDGPINAHSNGKTAYAIFIDGKRATPWQMGRAPSQQAIAQRIEKARQRVAGKRSAEPSAPNIEAQKVKASKLANEPLTVAKTESTRAPTREVTAGSEVLTSGNGSPENVMPGTEAKKPPQHGVDESLRLLAQPPSSLRTESTSETFPRPLPNRGSTSDTEVLLTKEKMVELADAQARAAGYDLENYERPKTEYNADTGNWFLVYDRKLSGATPESPQRFNVTIDNRTKKAVAVTIR